MIFWQLIIKGRSILQEYLPKDWEPETPKHTVDEDDSQLERVMKEKPEGKR